MEKHKKNIKAFTLVELIVVITILSILWTIAFISLQWYSSNSRDSVRISDVWNMKTSLELFHLNSWKYPLPDEWNEVSYGWDLLWTQWKFWESVVKNLSRNLSEVPKDPLTDRMYVYSTTNAKNEYQILSLMENDDFTLNEIMNKTNAEDLKVTTKVDWIYNWVFVKTPNYIVPTPSLINAEVISSNITLNTTNIKSQVINKWWNIPTNLWNVLSKTWALNMNFSVYNWSITTKSTDTEKLNVIQAIQNAYTGSELSNDDKIIKILSTTDTNELIALTETIVLNNSSSNSKNNEIQMQIIMTSCPTWWNENWQMSAHYGWDFVTFNQNYKICEWTDTNSIQEIITETPCSIWPDTILSADYGWNMINIFSLSSWITFSSCSDVIRPWIKTIMPWFCPVWWSDRWDLYGDFWWDPITFDQTYKVCEKQ